MNILLVNPIIVVHVIVIIVIITLFQLERIVHYFHDSRFENCRYQYCFVCNTLCYLNFVSVVIDVLTAIFYDNSVRPWNFKVLSSFSLFRFEPVVVLILLRRGFD